MDRQTDTFKVIIAILNVTEYASSNGIRIMESKTEMLIEVLTSISLFRTGSSSWVMNSEFNL